MTVAAFVTIVYYSLITWSINSGWENAAGLGSAIVIGIYWIWWFALLVWGILGAVPVFQEGYTKMEKSERDQGGIVLVMDG